MLAGCIVLALVMAAIGREMTGSPGRPLVTVQGLPAAAGPAGEGGALGSIEPQGDSGGRRLGDALVLSPHMFRGQIAGYVVSRESSAPIVARARLRPGDILMEVDGQPLDPRRVGALADELSLLDRVEVTVERKGQVRTLMIDLTTLDSNAVARRPERQPAD